VGYDGRPPLVAIKDSRSAPEAGTSEWRHTGPDADKARIFPENLPKKWFNLFMLARSESLQERLNRFSSWLLLRMKREFNNSNCHHYNFDNQNLYGGNQRLLRGTKNNNL